MPSRQTRLTRNIEKQGKKQFFIYLIGIVVILFLLLNYGIVIISEISNKIATISSDEEVDATDENAPLLAPRLDPIDEATSSARVNISGNTSYEDSIVQIFINGKLYRSIDIKNDTSFDLKNVSLTKGNNTIKALAKVGDKESDYSDEYEIVYQSEPPKLEIEHPSENATFSKADQQIEVKGKTDPDSDVTVNGFRAIVNSDGSYKYLLRLNDGENTLKIVAENPGGLKTEKEFKVTYQP